MARPSSMERPCSRSSRAETLRRGVGRAEGRIGIGPPRAEESYQSIPAVVSAALATRADAVHPGYGFLAENGDLAEALRHSGVAFVGPRARHLRLMGDKARARRFMARAGVPVLPGAERPPH